MGRLRRAILVIATEDYPVVAVPSADESDFHGIIKANYQKPRMIIVLPNHELPFERQFVSWGTPIYLRKNKVKASKRKSKPRSLNSVFIPTESYMSETREDETVCTVQMTPFPLELSQLSRMRYDNCFAKFNGTRRAAIRGLRVV